MTNSAFSYKFVIAALIVLILVGIAIVGFKGDLPELWKVDRTTPESVEFAQKIQNYVIENMGQPIEGFDAPLYLQAFPGLTEADFDGVETWEGRYVYAGGKLTFTRPQTGRASTAEEAITKNGHRTLFDALRKRLGSDLSVDEIINRIQNYPSRPYVSVGDTLGAMTVVSVAPFNTGQYSTDPKMMQLGPQNAKVILRGPIEIMGTYSAINDPIGFNGYCMSVSDTASLARLPVLPVNGVRPDVSSYFFCFRNGETARQQLGEESRTITATIDNFELNAYPAEVMTWADLINVVKQ